MATGPEPAGPAPPAPRPSFMNSGEVTTRTTASQYRPATAGARWRVPTRTLRLSPQCRASRCEIAHRLRGHVEQQRHAVDRGVGAADHHQLPRIQLTAGTTGRSGIPNSAGRGSRSRSRLPTTCRRQHQMRLNPQLRAHAAGRHGTVGQRPPRYRHPTGPAMASSTTYWARQEQKYVATEPTIRNATDVPRQHRP
jgi:hypothetical protein